MENKTKILQKIIVDTDLFVDFLRGHPPSRDFFKKVEQKKFDAYISIITVTELMSGESTKSIEEQIQIENMVDLFKIIHVNFTIGKYAGFIMRESKIKLADSIIAASAKSFKCKLATRNIKDFSKVKNLSVFSPYSK